MTFSKIHCGHCHEPIDGQTYTLSDIRQESTNKKFSGQLFASKCTHLFHEQCKQTIIAEQNAASFCVSCSQQMAGPGAPRRSINKLSITPQLLEKLQNANNQQSHKKSTAQTNPAPITRPVSPPIQSSVPLIEDKDMWNPPPPPPYTPKNVPLPCNTPTTDHNISSLTDAFVRLSFSGMGTCFFAAHEMLNGNELSLPKGATVAIACGTTLEIAQVVHRTISNRSSSFQEFAHRERQTMARFVAYVALIVALSLFNTTE